MNFQERFKGRTQKISKKGIEYAISNQMDDVLSSYVAYQPNKLSKLQTLTQQPTEQKQQPLLINHQVPYEDLKPKKKKKKLHETDILMDEIQQQLARIEIQRELTKGSSTNYNENFSRIRGMRSLDFHLLSQDQNKAVPVYPQQSVKISSQQGMIQSGVFGAKQNNANKYTNIQSYSNRQKEKIMQNGNYVLKA